MLLPRRRRIRCRLPLPPSTCRCSACTFARSRAAGYFALEWQGQLVFVSPEAPGWKLGLLPTADPDVFTVEPGSNFAGEDVVFSRLADGRVASVLFVESSFVRLDPVGPGG